MVTPLPFETLAPVESVLEAVLDTLSSMLSWLL